MIEVFFDSEEDMLEESDDTIFLGSTRKRGFEIPPISDKEESDECERRKRIRRIREWTDDDEEEEVIDLLGDA